METADSIFESELHKRGIVASRTRDGLYELQIDERKVSVSLENVRRDYARNRDSRAVVEFVEQATRDLFAEIPGWEDVRPFVRFCLEPSDYEGGFGGTLRDTVTDELCRVYAFTPPDGSQITWIDEFMLRDWHVTRDDVVRQADQNMRAIVAATKLEYEEIDGVKLGMLSTKETAFKASLILSPAFRQLVSPTHGWPVYVVTPCRDFVYVISTANRGFLARVGRVVVNEYRKSGHPITKDVLEVGDDGVKAIGTFSDS
jgi:uncharacterized protein YtpQ (UPF0354 family)